MTVIADVIQLLRDAETAVEQLRAAERREADTARRMYRRGWRAGYFAGRRGAPPITNPERHARGEMRALMEDR